VGPGERMSIRKEKEREAREIRKWADWVERTQEQIVKEAELRSERGEGGGGWRPHPPVELIPDNDWQGETWGLYFSDIDIEGIQEDPEKLVTKHCPDPEDITNLLVEVTPAPESLLCPAPKLPTPPPPPSVKELTPPPPPPPVKKLTPPPPPPVQKKATPPPPPVKRLPPPPPRRVVFKEPTPPREVKMGKCSFCDFTSDREDMMKHMRGVHQVFL